MGPGQMSLDTLIPMIKPSEVELIVSKRKQTLSNRMIFGIILSYATITKDILAEHILFLSKNARVCHIFVHPKSISLTLILV